MQKRFWLGFLATLFILFSVSLSADSLAATNTPRHIPNSAAYATIRQLLAANKAEEAFQRANQIAPQEEGNIEFDMLLGNAALIAKHPDAAAFAFERVLMQQPHNHYAKVKLAQAYFSINDYAASKALLQSIIVSPATPSLIAQANDLLTQMQHPPINNTQIKASNNFSIEIAGGYDSNVNSATRATVEVFPQPGFGTVIVPLLRDHRQMGDECFDLYADWQGFHPLPASNEAGLFWDMNAAYRDNMHTSPFNLNTFNSMGGLQLQHGVYTLRVPLRAQLMYLDGQALRRVLAMGINVTRPIINAQHAAMVFAERGAQVYPLQQVLSSTTNIAGGGWLYLPNDKTQAITRAFYGVNDGMVNEFPWITTNLTKVTSDAFASHYYGAQLSLSRTIFDRGTASIELGGQASTFNRVDPLFLALRKDKFFNLGLKYEWKYSRDITLVGNYVYYKNNSTLPIYQYNRNVAEIGLRYSL